MYRRQHIYGPEDYYNRQMEQHSHDYHPPHFTQSNQDMYPEQHGFQRETPFEYFMKPEQPTDWPISMQQDNMNAYQQHYPMNNQYQPLQYQMNHQNPPQYSMNNQSQPPGFLTQFQDGNGQMNLDKVLSTVSQLANTFQQVTPVIQQMGAMIKTFR